MYEQQHISGWRDYWQNLKGIAANIFWRPGVGEVLV